MSGTAERYDHNQAEQPAEHQTWRQRRATERDKARLPPATQTIPRRNVFRRMLPVGLSQLEARIMEYVRDNTDDYGRDFHHSSEWVAEDLRVNQGSVRNALDRLRLGATPETAGNGRGKDGLPLLLNDGTMTTASGAWVRVLAINPAALVAAFDTHAAGSEVPKRSGRKRTRCNQPMTTRAPENHAPCVHTMSLDGAHDVIETVHTMSFPDDTVQPLKLSEREGRLLDNRARTCADADASEQASHASFFGQQDVAPVASRDIEEAGGTVGVYLFSGPYDLAPEAEAQPQRSIVTEAPQEAPQGVTGLPPLVQGTAIAEPEIVTPESAAEAFCRVANDQPIGDTGMQIDLGPAARQVGRPEGRYVATMLAGIPARLYPLIVMSAAHRHRKPITWLSQFAKQVEVARRLAADNAPPDLLALDPEQALERMLVNAGLLPSPTALALSAAFSPATTPVQAPAPEPEAERRAAAERHRQQDEARAADGRWLADLIDAVGRHSGGHERNSRTVQEFRKAFGALPSVAEIVAPLDRQGITAEERLYMTDARLIAMLKADAAAKLAAVGTAA